ncbi:tRNA 2-selenouridine(34) synthase MnmH [Hydrogenophilus thiooxidans]|uniref:tRNA 2-selenouridine(34) synthase MnmH n=1 Tax=Hydrogenophilus thiooxidans TaxID=2820326 RepID=UPI001C24DF83|nr:tRNA 2-selenouridine(34) synthase MnmH [Hydrogenophilus thiooxidans]
MPRDSTSIVPVTALDAFDTVIDARSPAEYAEDHVPGAINCPVLDDRERAIVGTIYKQRSPFEARRIGGAWVAKNIAHHIENQFQDKPRSWHPLVYCWRGGQRSGAFVTWLRLIGWDAAQLEGGYKAFRRQVLAQLNTLPARLRLFVLAGPTGCGKTKLLHTLAQLGAQVLDLEGLARHRGSLLGRVPDGAPQPTQKAFETALWSALRRFDPTQPVFVEAENRRIGTCHLPEALWQQMRAAPRVTVDAALDTRLALVLTEYRFWRDHPETLKAQLLRLKGVVPNAVLAEWLRWVDAGNFAALYRDLMVRHYDPRYRKGLATWSGPIVAHFTLSDLSEATFADLAAQLVAIAATCPLDATTRETPRA